MNLNKKTIVGTKQKKMQTHTKNSNYIKEHIKNFFPEICSGKLNEKYKNEIINWSIFCFENIGSNKS